MSTTSLHKLTQRGVVDMTEKKDLNVLIGANIRQARESAGFTQEKFSELIGIGPKSLSAIERGTVGISLAALRRVCSTLSVSSDALLFGRTETNDVSALTARLALLPPEDFRLCSEIICKLLEAFPSGRT